VEATPGVAVPATRQLSSIGITPAVQADVKRFRPRGSKFPTVSALGKEWVEADIDGTPTYNEIVYLLASIFRDPAITTPTGGEAARKWVFSPSSVSADPVKTVTVEQGGPNFAERFSYGICTELSLELDRDEFNLGGTMMGRRLETGVNLTPGATALDLVPILPSDFNVYLADTRADLDTAQPLERALGLELNCEDRFGPVWAINRAYKSYAAHVETEPDLTLDLTLAADNVGLGFLNVMRAGGTKFVRLESIGPIIEGTIPYLFQVDMATQVEEPDDFDDEDGVYAIGWTLGSKADAVWGKAIEVTVVNALAAL
jgi:hypothetical protein